MLLIIWAHAWPLPYFPSLCVCVSCLVVSNSLRPHGWQLTRLLCHGIIQAGLLEWVTVSFSRGCSWPREQTRISCIAGRFFFASYIDNLLKGTGRPCHWRIPVGNPRIVELEGNLATTQCLSQMRKTKSWDLGCAHTGGRQTGPSLQRLGPS